MNHANRGHLIYLVKRTECKIVPPRVYTQFSKLEKIDICMPVRIREVFRVMQMTSVGSSFVVFLESLNIVFN